MAIDQDQSTERYEMVKTRIGNAGKSLNQVDSNRLPIQNNIKPGTPSGKREWIGNYLKPLLSKSS